MYLFDVLVSKGYNNTLWKLKRILGHLNVVYEHMTICYSATDANKKGKN